MKIRHYQRRRLLIFSAAAAPLVALLVAAPTQAGPPAAGHHPGGPPKVSPLHSSGGEPGDDGGAGEGDDIRARAEQWAEMRAAPGRTVPQRAFYAGQQQGAALPQAKGKWHELTTQPYQNDAPDYRDPVWSNGGGGWGYTSGRTAALATSGSRTVYAGGAAGGVWVSQDRGAHWQPIFDRQSDLSIGAVAVDPANGDVWVGEGEANLSADEYGGDGIYRSTNGGHSWQRVGDTMFGLHTSRIVFDGQGDVYAATNHGVVRHSSTGSAGSWQSVLAPAGDTNGSWATDVQVRPGTGGQTVAATVANGGGGTGAQNGFYVSTDGGTSWQHVATTGDLDTAQMGRTSFQFSPDGGTVYAISELAGNSGFYGVFKSTTGVAGPWTKIADHDTFAPISAYGACAGCQGWYNQYVTVDPKDPSHVYVGLEEIYESSDGGKTWSDIGPYWNFGLPCYNSDPAKDTCPPTTHPDQHSMAFGADGTAYFGNDGGVYSRPAALRKTVSWHDDNARLHTLQYYSVGAGKVAGGDAVWGGMQDNGTSVLLPHAREMSSPFGGDGGFVLVDPADGNRAVNEYVYLNMARTENGGRSDGTTQSYTTANPSCDNVVYKPTPCDPSPMFIAPYSADIHDVDHWVAGGRYVWDNQGKGWSTVCDPSTCDWKQVHDTGAQITAVVASGDVTYAAWQYRDSAGTYHSGIDTNDGGTWHRVAAGNLPSRYITAISIDPADAGHVYVSFGGYTEKWVPGAGTGHVFESHDGAATFKDVTGDLPDLPTDWVSQWQGNLVAATDSGVYVTPLGSPGSWKRLGHGLPNSPGTMTTVAPSTGELIAATHGRGLWTIR
ncbi:MAG: WD40/YVTN/BNR-like repeat-containing protein [Marmoricola sp.]